MSEQELFGLMAVAQDQQQAAALTLQRLEAQQVELAAIIGKARSAVEAMSNAGTASAVLIEKATKNAVEKGVQSALERISEQAKRSLADAINPAVKALHGVTERAVEVEESIRDTANAFSWKWASVCIFAACALLLTVWSLAWILTPGYGEVAELRANVAALEAKGGKVQLSTCGPKGRLCARVSANDAAVIWGPPDKENEKWIILNGY
jgi:hypothetical protein